MTQRILNSGEVVPVTVIDVGSCRVVKILTKEKEGYDAVLLGCGAKEEKKCNMPEKGFWKKCGLAPLSYLKEFRGKLDGVDEEDYVKIGVFSVDDRVNVRGKSIGKGFAGTIKRWGFSRGPMTHGSKSHRIPGSIGGGTTPGRVIKGKKMPGRLGTAMRTISNLPIVEIDKERGLIYLRGAVPGKAEGYVELLSSIG